MSSSRNYQLAYLGPSSPKDVSRTPQGLEVNNYVQSEVVSLAVIYLEMVVLLESLCLSICLSM